MSETTLNPLWDSFIRTVREGVKPASGCTEPISLALAAAIASSGLGGAVERVDAWVSPNLMKDGMSATVPGTGIAGLLVAAALGALGGDARVGLEVLKDASPQAIVDAKAMPSAGKVTVMLQRLCEDIFFSRAKVYSTGGWACVAVVGGYTNVVHIETNKGIVFTTEQSAQEKEQGSSLAVLSRIPLKEILAFVNTVPFESIHFILDAIKLNGALSQEGLRGNWGLHIGTTLEERCTHGLLANDLPTSILIRTSAVPDARVGEVTLPAMGNSGSGNQDITTTVPVMAVAKHFGVDEEKLTRALMLSHLSTIYIRHQLPRLSALCVATTAAMGATAGVAWIVDDRYNTVAMAIGNMIGDVNGMICDGASNSCAVKVSASAPAAWKVVLMALDDTAITGNEGTMAHNVK